MAGINASSAGRIEAKLLTERFPRSEVLRNARAAQEAAGEAALPLLQEAKEEIFGQTHLTLSQMRNVGHPYSAQSPMPEYWPDGEAGIINRQSGDLYRSVQIVAPYLSSGRDGRQRVRGEIRVNDWKAEVLQEGLADNMVARPWQVLLTNRLNRDFLSRMNNELRKQIRLRFRYANRYQASRSGSFGLQQERLAELGMERE